MKLRFGDAPAAARVSIVGGDDKPYGPAGAAIRKTKRDESYFYADGSFDVELPPGRARMSVSGGIETIPQTVTLDAGDGHRADGADAADGSTWRRGAGIRAIRTSTCIRAARSR